MSHTPTQDLNQLMANQLTFGSVYLSDWGLTGASKTGSVKNHFLTKNAWTSRLNTTPAITDSKITVSISVVNTQLHNCQILVIMAGGLSLCFHLYFHSLAAAAAHFDFVWDPKIQSLDSILCLFCDKIIGISSLIIFSDRSCTFSSIFKVK